MPRPRREQGHGPSRWYRAAEAIATIIALSTGLFAILEIATWLSTPPRVGETLPTLALATCALGARACSTTARRRAERIEARERERASEGTHREARETGQDNAAGRGHGQTRDTDRHSDESDTKSTNDERRTQ